MTAHIVVFVLFAVGQYLLPARIKETEWRKSLMYVPRWAQQRICNSIVIDFQ